MRRREHLALAALGFIIVVTVGWWAAALWPLPATTPEWVVRARAACFGATESGLPNAGGWIMLIGTPISMLAALLVIWGGDVRDGLRLLAGTLGGRAAMLGVSVALVFLAGSAYVRVVTAAGYGGWDKETAASSFIPKELSRLDKPTPPLALVDQHGEVVGLERFRGRPVLVTFAYGRCETVCPVIVHNVMDARAELEEIAPVVLVLTLDPWRDTPTRLPHIARAWQLEDDQFVLGGSVEQVESTLDAWQIARVRDPRTGEIAHPSLVYVIDAEGRMAYAVTGSTSQIVQAVRRL